MFSVFLRQRFCADFPVVMTVVPHFTILLSFVILLGQIDFAELIDGTICSDTSPQCHRLAREGDCQRRMEFMKKHCRASCGFCEKDTLAQMVNLAEAQTSYMVTFLHIFVIGIFIVVVKIYCAGGICRSRKKLDGKVVIITGATSGIGYYTALDLAWRRARVILACRDFKKGLKIMKEIQTLSRNPDIEVKKLDLTSFLSIRSFVADIMREEKRVDILINNAGVLPSWNKEITENGLEKCFQVNYLSSFLLTNLLLPKMAEGGEKDKRRIVNVSSAYYRESKGINFENLQGEKIYGAWSAYKASKLALQLHTYELSKRLNGTNITVNSVHPGLSITNIHRRWTFVGKSLVMLLASPLLWLFFKSAKHAAQTTLHCCVSEEVENVNGGYFVDCVQVTQGAMATDDGVARKLWEVSERLVHL